MSGDGRKVPKRRFVGFEGEWVERTLGEIADIVRGSSPRPIQDPKWFDEESDVGWLRISDVTEQDGRIHYLEQRISVLGQEKTRVLTEPHLLLSIAATVGKPVINYVNTGVHDGFLIFLNPQFNREFMFQWLEMFRVQWQKYGQPGSQVNLNSEIVKNQRVAIPSSEEQNKISNLFINLDRTIAIHQRKLEKVKILKNAYLTEMFPAEGETRPKRRFPGFTAPWEQRKLGDVIEKLAGGAAIEPIDYQDKGVRTIPKGAVNDSGTADLSGSKYVSREFYERNISSSVSSLNLVTSLRDLVPSAPNMGRIVRITGDDEIFLMPQGVYKLMLKEGVDEDFVIVYSNSERYRKIISAEKNGSTQVHIRNGEFLNIKIPLPSSLEQQKIGNFFSTLDQAITLHQRKLEKLKTLKQAYLSEMFV